MSYASTDDLEMAAGGAANLVALADWDADTVADATVIARALEAADGFIDGHLRLKITPVELNALRAAPTPTISELAAAEAVYWLKKSRNMASPEDIAHRKERERELDLMRSGQVRPSDSPKAQRSTWVENDGPVTRKNTRGMW